jgi:hypothetical protein
VVKGLGTNATIVDDESPDVIQKVGRGIGFALASLIRRYGAALDGSRTERKQAGTWSYIGSEKKCLAKWSEDKLEAGPKSEGKGDDI